MEVETVTKEDVEHQVFLAVEEDKYLPVGELVLLEVLGREDDGVFETKDEWKAFILDNFGTGEKNEFWHEGTCEPATIAKWCYDEKEYKHRFVQQIASDTYAKVPAKDVVLTFTYDTNFYNLAEPDMPCQVEIYVKASLKQ